MTNAFSVKTAIAVLFISAVTANAAGIFSTPSARANAMGVAYIAIADDPTAIYWNPAGLGQLQGTGMEISGSYAANPANSNRSLGNAASPDPANDDFPLPLLHSGESPVYSSKSMDTIAPIPFLGAYSKYRSITLGAGIYVIGGGGGYWKSAVPGLGQDVIKASADSVYYLMAYNLSAGMEVYPGLYAGLGMDILTMNDSVSVTKEYLPDSVSPSESAYRFSIDQKSSGYGVQLNGGVICRVNPQLRVGAVARSGAAMDMSGKTKVFLAGESNFDRKYIYPATYGLGIAYEPASKWTLAAGLDQNMYSSMRNEVTYETPVPGLFENTHTDAGWKDTLQYRLGAEYRYTPKLALRAGIQTDPSPLKSEQLTLLDTNKFNVTFYSIGAGYTWSTVTLDFCYARGVSDTPTWNGRVFEMPMDVVMLEMNKKF